MFLRFQTTRFGQLDSVSIPKDVCQFANESELLLDTSASFGTPGSPARKFSLYARDRRIEPDSEFRFSVLSK